MATNFEFYKDEILGLAKRVENFSLVNGKINRCKNTNCAQCYFKTEEGNCVSERICWLYAEHIEPPKLTKRERAFCEAVQTGWLARDKNGKIHWYSDKPYKEGEEWCYAGDRFVDFTNLHLFSCVKWEDEKPWAVEDLLKLEVMEEVQHETD